MRIMISINVDHSTVDHNRDFEHLLATFECARRHKHRWSAFSRSTLLWLAGPPNSRTAGIRRIVVAASCHAGRWLAVWRVAGTTIWINVNMETVVAWR